MLLKTIWQHWVLRMVVGIRKLWTSKDGWIYGASVHVTSRINSPIRLIAYCVLFVGEVSDASVIRHATSASLRDNYRYKNKLEQYSVLCVRDGSEVEGDWLFTSVSVTILPVLGTMSQWPHKKCYAQCVKELTADQGTSKGTNTYQKGRSQCIYNKKCGWHQHWFKSAGGLAVHQRLCNPR